MSDKMDENVLISPGYREKETGFSASYNKHITCICWDYYHYSSSSKFSNGIPYTTTQGATETKSTN